MGKVSGSRIVGGRVGTGSGQKYISKHIRVYMHEERAGRGNIYLGMVSLSTPWQQRSERAGREHATVPYLIIHGCSLLSLA